MKRVEGKVVRRQVMNRVLGFFDVQDLSDESEHAIQVRIKSTELTRKQIEENSITYSADGSMDCEGWRVKDIVVNTYLAVEGVVEITARGTTRLSAQWIQIYSEPPATAQQHTL